jgi:hypothetical protein
MSDKTEILKAVGDFSAVSITVATVFNWLPAVAALFTILWTATRLYEAVTGKQFSESKLAKLLSLRKLD